MWKNNFKKYFNKVNFKRVVLILIVGIIFIFSFYSLFRINKMNFWINKECEKRVYTNYTREEMLPISNEQREELEKVDAECNLYKKYLMDKNADVVIHLYGPQKYIPLTDLPLNIKQSYFACQNSGGYEKVKSILNSGHEAKMVPDEEKRAISRQEVGDYQECLKNQKEATKERPEAYKFLIIVDSIILVIGLLLLKFW